ncbi:MAG TPA: hypothetical protein ENH82_08255 [bacterium]|nr:hypothetical protein [bacterium]
MPKTLRVFGWFLQLAGVVVLLFAFGIFHKFYNIKDNILLCLIAYVLIAWGRKVYLPEVKLLKSCPYCANQIRMVETVCPHCQRNLPEKSRFPGS